jgi:hypothetical protein
MEMILCLDRYPTGTDGNGEVVWGTRHVHVGNIATNVTEVQTGKTREYDTVKAEPHDERDYLIAILTWIGRDVRKRMTSPQWKIPDNYRRVKGMALVEQKETTNTRI